MMGLTEYQCVFRERRNWTRPASEPAKRFAMLPVVVCLFINLKTLADDAPAKENQKLSLLFHEDFKAPDEAIKGFTFTDKEAWRVDQEDVNGQKRNVLW